MLTLPAPRPPGPWAFPDAAGRHPQSARKGAAVLKLGRQGRQGRHRHTPGHRAPRPRTIEMVDAHTGTAHQLTYAAVDAARDPHVNYIAVCGTVIAPASLATPPQRHCRSCMFIPGQRTS
jgi:hypothetical protein